VHLGPKIPFKRQRPRRSNRDGKCVPDTKTPITLASIPVAAEDETKHFKCCIGTTGTGKSTAIREMLSTARARGDRAVIADPDGGYLSHFYDPDRGDVILNPFDPDAVRWNLLGEITSDHDVDQLARPLIPDSGGSDRIWSGYARTFFTAVVQQVVAARIHDDGEIYRLVTKASVQELKLLLAGTVAGPFLEDANDRMFGSVRAVTASAVGALRYTAQQRAAPFSVRQWVGQGGPGLGGRPGRRAVHSLQGRRNCGAALGDFGLDAHCHLRSHESTGRRSTSVVCDRRAGRLGRDRWT
jgi:hypothetical protein